MANIQLETSCQLLSFWKEDYLGIHGLEDGGDSVECSSNPDRMWDHNHNSTVVDHVPALDIARG